MKASEGEIMRLAGLQHGVVERRQLVMFGFSHAMIRNRVARGILVEKYPGAYRIQGAPESWKGNLMAAQLSLGPSAVVSHRSSAALYELEGHPPGMLELITKPHSRRVLRGVRQHRAESLRPEHLRRLEPFITTTPERLLLDLAAVESPRLVDAAIDSALFRGLTTLSRVKSFLAEVRRPGLNGVRRLDERLQIRDPDRAPAESFFETDFFRFLLEATHLPAPTFQFRVEDDRGPIGRLDVAYPDRRIGVEAHSLRFHSARERVQKDADRHNRLSTAGWTVLYETYENLNERPGEVLARLEKLLLSDIPE